MVMGLISSKVPELESEDDLLRQMERAAAIVGGIDRLAISPQCGFASVMVGNDTDPDAQWRKLELVGRIADRLWPR
jgi:5-methyltetrahydropteroyltriglutamate--homocysteine methyltransferase